MPQRRLGWLLVISFVLLAMACACVALAVGVGVLWVRRVPLSPAPIGSASLHLEELVSQEQMPPYDPVVEVSGLQGGREIPRIVHESPVAYEVGDRQPFWVSGLDNSAAYQITATLYVQLDNVQMWVDEQAQVDLSALYASATTFQDRVQPTTRRYFGTEWSPGIDGDPRLVVLSANIEGAAGYFASANEYARQVHANSNEREMFVMNLNALTPGSVGFDAVLAHEYQHMIHWHQDRNEDTWVNEGASDLSEELNGFDSSQVTLRAFGQNPDLQLTSWPDGDDSVVAHYGASYLMMHYFLRRYGPDMLRELILEPANGAVGFDAVLARHEAGTDFDGLFADWVVANGVDDPDWDDGRFGYALLDVNAASAESSMQRIGRYPAAVQGDVSQYGADYFELAPAGPGGQPLRLTFSGQPSVRLVPNDPTSGEYQWWSNRGDGGHSYLERVFDLREVQAATLAFDLWYDIEEGWDYAHVRASTDGGRTWQLLRGSHMTDYNPEGNAWGPGYTGQSGDTVSFAMRQGEGSDAQWVREEIDLGAYVGDEVLVRFDYITDDGVNRPGLCLDSLALRAIGWRDDVEEGEAGWHTEGFIRHNNHVPQRFVVQLVEFTPQPQLRRLTTEPGQELQWTIEGLGGRVERALLIVSAIAPVTTERASYRLRMQ